MQLTLVSDPHIGLTRKAGATAQSMKAYSEFQMAVLHSIEAEELLVTGDLFSSYDAGPEAVLAAWQWLSRYSRVSVLQGNHDASKNKEKMSSLDFLGHIMPSLRIIREPVIEGEIAYVPHLTNQEIFDAAIEKVAETATVLVTHANYANFFAAEREHSLNLTPEQSALFELVLSGHEHNKSLRQNVHMLGSPYPCSIAEISEKFIHTWDGENAPEPFRTWSSENCIEIDWHNLTPSSAQFIRVVGEATADEAALVLQEFSEFRRKSDAFMITNSVKIGSLEIGELEEAAGELDVFDPVAALMSVLSEDHKKQIEEVLGR